MGEQIIPVLTILAADDTRTNLKLLEAFLGKLGHRVILAENGQEAVEAFKEHQPDLVLLDIMMPVLDGFSAARLIKAASRRWVPIIFLSALEREQNLLAGLEAGGDDYLGKPINFVILEAKLRSLQQALFFQKSAAESRDRLDRLSNSILDAIITIDRHGTIVACNQATDLMFQWPPGALLGQNIAVLMPQPEREEHDLYVRNYLNGGMPSVIGTRREVTAVRRDGTPFPAEISVSELREAGERLFVGVMHDVTEKHRTQQQLNAYYQALKEEQALAKHLIEKQLHRPGLQDPLVTYWVAPTAAFSGDVVASARSPAGGRYALLADATGHGLAAAISVLPVLALFYRMTSQAKGLTEIIREINQQLRESVPAGRFVALALACLDDGAGKGEVWVGGIPDALLLDEWGRITARFPSSHLPLGIVDNDELDCTPATFDWCPGRQLLFCSDGLIEAEDEGGQAFGKAGLEQALAHTGAPGRKSAVAKALVAHLGSAQAKDDISLLLVNYR